MTNEELKKVLEGHFTAATTAADQALASYHRAVGVANFIEFLLKTLEEEKKNGSE